MLKDINFITGDLNNHTIHTIDTPKDSTIG